MNCVNMKYISISQDRIYLYLIYISVSGTELIPISLWLISKSSCSPATLNNPGRIKLILYSVFIHNILVLFVLLLFARLLGRFTHPFLNFQLLTVSLKFANLNFSKYQLPSAINLFQGHVSCRKKIGPIGSIVLKFFGYKKKTSKV